MPSRVLMPAMRQRGGREARDRSRERMVPVKALFGTFCIVGMLGTGGVLLSVAGVTAHAPMVKGGAEACAGAQLAVVHQVAAALQERQTPPGEWCQRPEQSMSRK